MKRVLISTALTGDYRNLRTLLEACHTLQVLRFGMVPFFAQFLGSIPSNSVSLIHLDPLEPGTPTPYSVSWPWPSFESFERYLNDYEEELAEFTHLGVSIRNIAQRFSDHHPGLKTRVRVTLDLTGSEVQAVGGGPLVQEEA